MKRAILSSALSATLMALSLGAETPRLCSTKDIRNAIYANTATGSVFEITATLVKSVRTSPEKRLLLVEDSSGGATLLAVSTNSICDRLSAGDALWLKGELRRLQPDHYLTPRILHWTLLGHGSAPTVPAVSVEDFCGGDLDFRIVRITGAIEDVVDDYIDKRFANVVIASGSRKMLMQVWKDSDDYRRLRSAIGKQVATSGYCNPLTLGVRRQSGRLLQNCFDISTSDNDSGQIGPFNVPELGITFHLQPEQLILLGRRRISGKVVAVWNGTRALVRTPAGHIVKTSFASVSTPSYGDWIELSGIPETDLLSIVFDHAIWRPTTPRTIAYEPPETDRSIREILSHNLRNGSYQAPIRGAVLRFRGIVRSLPTPDSRTPQIQVEDEGYVLPVDIQAAGDSLSGLSIGCRVEVTGAYILDSDCWRPNCPFPGVTDILVSIRTPDDVRILSRPSWWTAARLAWLIGALSVLCIGVIIWNVSLQRLSRRYGRDLANEQIAHAKSDMRTMERTRLAVELHDSIAQNLTSVAMEIEAARLYDASADANLRRHLKIADRTLDACRNEIRNCLWDLRNDALEEKSLDVAVMKTLAPHLNGAGLRVQFDIPREMLTDSTAHDILCIVRELAANAVRHGGASRIDITGGLAGGDLRFSVRDNGCGFCPEDAPGASEGHFGIQGIRERINAHGGSFSYSSTGNGTTATITIKVAGT